MSAATTPIAITIMSSAAAAGVAMTASVTSAGEVNDQMERNATGGMIVHNATYQP